MVGHIRIFITFLHFGFRHYAHFRYSVVFLFRRFCSRFSVFYVCCHYDTSNIVRCFRINFVNETLPPPHPFADDPPNETGDTPSANPDLDCIWPVSSGWVLSPTELVDGTSFLSNVSDGTAQLNSSTCATAANLLPATSSAISSSQFPVRLPSQSSAVVHTYVSCSILFITNIYITFIARVFSTTQRAMRLIQLIRPVTQARVWLVIQCCSHMVLFSIFWCDCFMCAFVLYCVI